MSCIYANPRDMEHMNRRTQLMDVKIGDVCMSCYLSKHGDKKTWLGMWRNYK